MLWRNRTDYVSLLWGFGGPGGLVLRGYVGGEPLVAGRGWLPSGREQGQLRMECRAGRVRALCTPDGDQWYRVGETDWDAALPSQIGICAIGDIDRLVYPGSFDQGTEIAFRDVRVWGAKPAAGGATND